VATTDVERIASEEPRDLVDDLLDADHALRAAEAAERRVRLRVRLAAIARDPDIAEVVAVVAVEHRAVVDRSRQIGRVPAAAGERELDAENPAVTVETDFVVRDEVVTLARDQHVVVAVGP